MRYISNIILVLLTLLSITSVHAKNNANHFLCSFYNHEEVVLAYLADIENNHIYRIHYIDYKNIYLVSRFKILDMDNWNIHGKIEGLYIEDDTGKSIFSPNPEDFPKTILSLDRQKGFFVEMYTGIGDIYGPCKYLTVNIENIENQIKEIGENFKE